MESQSTESLPEEKPTKKKPEVLPFVRPQRKGPNPDVGKLRERLKEKIVENKQNPKPEPKKEEPKKEEPKKPPTPVPFPPPEVTKEEPVINNEPAEEPKEEPVKQELGSVSNSLSNDTVSQDKYSVHNLSQKSEEKPKKKRKPSSNKKQLPALFNTPYGPCTEETLPSQNQDSPLGFSFVSLNMFPVYREDSFTKEPKLKRESSFTKQRSKKPKNTDEQRQESHHKQEVYDGTLLKREKSFRKVSNKDTDKTAEGQYTLQRDPHGSFMKSFSDRTKTNSRVDSFNHEYIATKSAGQTRRSVNDRQYALDQYLRWPDRLRKRHREIIEQNMPLLLHKTKSKHQHSPEPARVTLPKLQVRNKSWKTM